MVDYLQGTAVGGLLSQPSLTQYTPGQGMPLYAPYTQQAGNSAANSIGNMFNTSQQAGNLAGGLLGGDISSDSFSGGASLDEVIKAAAPYGQGAIQQAVNAYNQRVQSNSNTAETPFGHGGYVIKGPESTSWNHSAGEGLWIGGGSGGGGGGGGGSSAAGAGGGAGSGTGGGLLSGKVTGLGQVGNGTSSGINPFPSIAGTNQMPSQAGQVGTIGQIPGANPIGGTGQIPGGQVGGGQPLNMFQSSPQNALQQYYNTAGYQLTNGQGAVNQFQTSPGYQFAVDQALNQVQRQGSSRGLLDSGAGLRAMTDRALNMANQEYNNWQQNQQNQYNNYQNRLQGLAGGNTGAEMAYGLGQTTANNAMNTGNNIGSLLANQGNTLFGGLVGAGGAQAQNVTQAGNMQAQILASNLQTQMMLAALAGKG